MAYRVICDRVKVAVPSGDRATREQVGRTATRALSQVSLDPSLPPAGILVVRRLRPSAPLSSAWQPLRAWEQQVQNQLAQCWRSAAHPAHGPVPQSANAVWFADQAEWLACLSWDLLQGVAHSHWWWDSWLKRPNPNLGDALTQQWQPEAHWLPATLQQLQNRHGAVVPLLATLSDAQAIALTHQVAAAYQLSPPVAPYPPPDRLERLPDMSLADLRSLSSAQRTLAQFCLTLATPASRQVVASGLSFLAEAETAVEPSPGPDSPAITSTATKNSLAVPGNSPPENLHQPAISDDNAAPAKPETRGNAAPESATSTPNPSPPNDLTSSEAITDNPSDRAPHNIVLDIPTIKNTTGSIPTPADAPIVTHFGGLWYLVNILTALDWPYPDLCPNPWHQLHALAQHLLAQPQHLAQPNPDPIWTLLLDLAAAELPAPTAWLHATLPLIATQLATLPHPLPHSPLPHSPTPPLPTPPLPHSPLPIPSPHTSPNPPTSTPPVPTSISSSASTRFACPCAPTALTATPVG